MKTWLFFICIILAFANPSIGQQEHSVKKYLALGDSYTIGESVTFTDRFPVQLSDRLKHAGIDVDVPVIVAKTGWTTDELLGELNENQPSRDYDLVTLLIGVNNQYRGRDLNNYREEFETLLKKAISFAGGDTTRIIVISIPDYGVTPFGKKHGEKRIEKEIDQFNQVNKQVSDYFGIAYVNITKISRMAAERPQLIANDGLHPSGEMYALWVEKILPIAKKKLKN